VELEVEAVRARFRSAFARDESDEARGPMSTSEEIEHRRWRRIVGSVLPEVPDAGRAFEELWDHFARPDSWRCFEDAGPAVAALRGAGLEVLVGSNFDSRLRGVLRGLDGLEALAESAVVSSEVGYRKPHPAFYRSLSDRLGLEPGRIAFVGDDPANDLDGPAAAGLRALLLDRAGRYGAGPDRLADLAQLPGKLGLA
jgi:putative hydrolase of the HAD superfamily